MYTKLVLGAVCVFMCDAASAGARARLEPEAGARVR